MNLAWLARNVGAAYREGIDWRSKFEHLRWVYSGHRLLGRGIDATYRLRLELPSPVGVVDLEVRGNRGADAFIFGEVFHHRYYDFNLASPPETILDLGANIGLTAIYLSRKYPQSAVACVEPMPGNASLLRRNLERNGIGATVFDAAVTTADGDVQMEVSPLDYGHKVASDGSRSQESIRVAGLSVPTILQRLGWKQIDLLKMDIEGYEAILLREHAGWLADVRAMCIELHDGFSLDDLQRATEVYGFAPPRALPGIVLVENQRFVSAAPLIEPDREPLLRSKS